MAVLIRERHLCISVSIEKVKVGQNSTASRLPKPLYLVYPQFHEAVPAQLSPPEDPQPPGNIPDPIFEVTPAHCPSYQLSAFVDKHAQITALYSFVTYNDIQR